MEGTKGEPLERKMKQQVLLENPFLKENPKIRVVIFNFDSRDLSAKVLVAVDVMRVKSPYFRDLLTYTIESEVDSECYTLPEDDPQAAAKLVIEMHAVVPTIKEWHYSWADLSRKWCISDIFVLYRGICVTLLNEILDALDAVDVATTCLVVVDSRAALVNGVYDCKMHNGEYYYEKPCSSNLQECYRIFKCPMQNSMVSTAPLTFHWSIGKFPFHAQHPPRQDLKAIWVAHANIFKTNFEAVAFLQHSSNSSSPGPRHAFSYGDGWIQYSDGSMSNLRVFAHKRALEGTAATFLSTFDQKRFWELVAFWLRCPTRPPLSGNLSTANELEKRLLQHETILGKCVLLALLLRILH